MNIYNDYCQIKLPRLNREACSNNFSQEPGKERQKSIDELLGTLQFSFTWDTFLLPSQGPGNRDWLLWNQFRDFPAALVNWPSQDFPSGFFHPLLGESLPRSSQPKQQWGLPRLWAVGVGGGGRPGFLALPPTTCQGS